MTKQRWLAIAGIAFVVLVAVSVLIVPNAPDSHASAAKVVSFFHKHKSGMVVSTYLTELAVFEGIAFFWYFRDHLVELNPAARRLATIGFSGALIFAVSGSIASGVSFALADGVNHIDPSSLQTLNVLNSDVNGFIGAPGVALFLATSGAIILKYRVLPVWLGWVGVVLAVVALVIGFFGLVGIGLWLLATCITILARADNATPMAAATP